MAGRSALASHRAGAGLGILVAGTNLRRPLGGDGRGALPLRCLQEECASLGRQRVFDTLQGALIASREEVSYEALSRELGVGVPELRNALHRLRQRYRQLLRSEVAATVESPDEVDSELRYLVAALAAGGH